MISYTPRSKYSWQIFRNGNLYTDLTGLCTNRKFTITRNDSDQIDFSISFDKLLQIANILHINFQSIIESWISEIRVSRYGIVLTAGELEPWDGNVGGDRMINLHFKGWLDLMKWRRTSDSYSSKSASFISQDLFSKTLARPYGSAGNYNGLVQGLVPSPDNTNIYGVSKPLVYDDKTLYDAYIEMSAEANGYDLEITWDKRFNIYYPHIGVERKDILFTYPHGNVKDIQYSSDPTKSFNYLKAKGKGNADSQILEIVTDDVSQQTYGLREDTKNYTNIGDKTQLINAAQSDLGLYKIPIILHTIIFDGSGRTSAPQVGTFHVGDRIPILVTNSQFFEDVNQFFQIDQIQVDIDENDMETVTMPISIPMS